MSSKIIFSIIFYIISQLAFCQTEKIIHGRIIVKDVSPQGVHIINLVNEEETVSNEKGEFNIVAKTDDLLVFSSNHLDYQRKIIEEDDYKSGSVSIEMTAKVTQLEQVTIIKYPEFDAVKLGILSTPAKKYTQAQRHLITARSTSLDALINTFSGRTKMLENELAIEREESLLTILSDLFDNDYYIKELKIEPDHIKGFQLYAVQDKKMASALSSKNKALISFILLQLSMDYNLLQRSDKP